MFMSTLPLAYHQFIFYLRISGNEKRISTKEASVDVMYVRFFSSSFHSLSTLAIFPSNLDVDYVHFTKLSEYAEQW